MSPRNIGDTSNVKFLQSGGLKSRFPFVPLVRFPLDADQLSAASADGLRRFVARFVGVVESERGYETLAQQVKCRLRPSVGRSLVRGRETTRTTNCIFSCFHTFVILLMISLSANSRMKSNHENAKVRTHEVHRT